MIDAGKKSGKLLQIGHCIRFWPEYVKLREMIKENKFGRLISARFQRFSPMPNWNAGNWLADEKRSGGMPMDLHIHDSDFIQHLFGMPKAVLSSADKSMSYISTTYLYDNDPVITAEASWAVTAGHGFNMNFKVIFENATVVYDCSKTPAMMVYPADGDGFAPQLEPGDGYSREVAHFFKCLKSGKCDPVLTPEQSRDTIKLVLAEKESARKGDKIVL
jgi:predicted dehydrogenase